jgi:rapamycin-insensitive companion of mTOR
VAHSNLAFPSVFPCLADQAGKEVRASAYRLLRHAMVRPPWKLVRLCREAGLDLYLTRTLLRDSRFDVEKEQALKLIRSIMEYGSQDESQEDLISVGVIRALIAASEHGEETLRHLYVETLAELGETFAKPRRKTKPENRTLDTDILSLSLS